MERFKTVDEVLREMKRLVSLVEEVRDELTYSHDTGVSAEVRDKITSFTYGLDNFVDRKPALALQLMSWEKQYGEEQEESSDILMESQLRGLREASRRISKKLRQSGGDCF